MLAHAAEGFPAPERYTMTVKKRRMKHLPKQSPSGVILILMVLLLAILPTTSGLGAGQAGGGEREAPAPLLINSNNRVIPDRYIVVFKEGLPAGTHRSVGDRFVSTYGAKIHHFYSRADLSY